MAFDAIFVGEAGLDAGGLYREAMDTFALEVETPAVPLTVPNPNKVVGVGENHDRRLWAPIVKPGSGKPPFPAQRRLLRFLGQMMGHSVRTKDGVMALNLSSLAWKQLVGETVTVADLAASDSSVVTFASKFMDLGASGMSREA